MHDPVTVLPVEQCDRDAAADCLDAIRGYAVGKAIREGRNDRGFSVQAFALHRIAAAQTERAAIVAWLRDDCPGCPYVAEYAVADAIESLAHRNIPLA